MAIRLSRAALAFVAGVAVLSCSEPPVSHVAPRPAADAPRYTAASLPAVRVAEIHYDNASTDIGEAIEISGPAGTSLAGWQLVLYNGSSTSRAPYGTTTLSGTIPATCGDRGVVVITYPSNGIQNGGTSGTAVTDPDGFALVNAGGSIVEFLSYEGVFTAASGVASGLTSTDIGVRELGTEAAGMSLQRAASGVWSGPVANTFGTCNDAAITPPVVVGSVAVTPDPATIVVGGTQAFSAAAFDAAGQSIAANFAWTTSDNSVATISSAGVATGVAVGDVLVIATADNGVADSATLHVTAAPPSAPLRIVELHYDNNSTDVGEAVEISGPAGASIEGWSVVLYNGNGGGSYATFPLTGTLPATCGARGVTVVPTPNIQNGSPDGVALVNASNVVVEFLSYEGVFAATTGPATGLTSVDIGVSESGNEAAGKSLQRDTTGGWYGPTAASFGSCNTPPVPVASSIFFTGRTPGDAPLPVGFEDQLFATLRNGDGATVTTTWTWASETPAIATVDAGGVLHALAAGTATVRATAADGTTATYSLPTIVATASTTAQYGHNTEFGEPTDANASDDFIVRRDQYTVSYSPVRNTPNWVAYDEDATHYGPEDRCDCFTFDPELPASYFHYTTADYTGAGTFHGYGIDRGHLARSFDRTSASLDNATTFYLSNIIPQAADLNQGPWAVLESYLGDLARFNDKEVFVIAGVAGSKGTLKDQGHITIPAQVWKVAVIMPRDRGLADVHDYRDVQVLAVVMPNDPGVRNVDWHTYQVTVDSVESLSGYDLLAMLPDKVEWAVEANVQPPFGALDGPYTGSEGSAVAMSGASSFDPNGIVASYDWSFGDGKVGSGASVSHIYANDGVYSVRLIVTDNDGLADTVSTTATIANVAPVIASIGGATLLPGETYTASGSFTDPGSDAWTATVDYGDGSGVSALSLTGTTFSLSHTYLSAGSYAVAVGVSDDDVTSWRSQTVTVLSPDQALDQAVALTSGLSNGTSLRAKLQAARAQVDAGRSPVAIHQLEALLNELSALMHSGRVAPADAAPLQSMVNRLIESLSR